MNCTDWPCPADPSPLLAVLILSLAWITIASIRGAIRLLRKRR